jgi:hypothetical protein
VYPSQVTRSGRVRRAKLYYLRGLTGKAARIKERRRPAHAAALNIRRVTDSAAISEPQIEYEPEVETTEVVDETEA